MELQLQEGLGDEVRRRTLLRRRARARKAAARKSKASLKLGALVRIVMIMLWVRRKHRDRKTSAGIHQTNQSNRSSEHDGINGGIDGEGADEFHADSDDDIATELILEAVVKNHGHAFDYPMSKSEKMIRSMQMTEGLWNEAQIEAVQYKWASLTLKLMM